MCELWGDTGSARANAGPQPGKEGRVRPIGFIRTGRVATADVKMARRTYAPGPDKVLAAKVPA